MRTPTTEERERLPARGFVGFAVLPSAARAEPPDRASRIDDTWPTVLARIGRWIGGAMVIASIPFALSRL